MRGPIGEMISLKERRNLRVAVRVRRGDGEDTGGRDRRSRGIEAHARGCGGERLRRNLRLSEHAVAERQRPRILDIEVGEAEDQRGEQLWISGRMQQTT